METKIAALKARLRGGVSPALSTPIGTDGYTVNTAVLPTLVNFLIDKNVSGLFVAGTTGEGIMLAQSERERLFEATMTAVNGRIPSILHVGANTLREAVALAKRAEALGAEAMAAVPPYFIGVGDDGLAAYFHALAEAAPNTPLFLYDIPQLAVNGITPALMVRLFEELPTLAGLKTSRAVAQPIRELLLARPEPLTILVGNESIALATLAMGADGMISGLSTAVPEPFVALVQSFFAGDIAAARKAHRLINTLLPILPKGARIGAIKQILQARGVEVGTAVPPRPTPSDSVWEQMQPLLSNLLD